MHFSGVEKRRTWRRKRGRRIKRRYIASKTDRLST